MIVTLTSKGQLTLPKAIRDQLKLDTGSKLDLTVEQDGRLSGRPMQPVASLFGIVKVPKTGKPATLQDLKDARAQYVADKHDRIVRESRAVSVGKNKQ